MARLRAIFIILMLVSLNASANAMIPAAKDTTITPAVHEMPASASNTGREGKMNTMAVVGFILSFLVPPVGIVLCAISLHDMRKRHQHGRGLAIAGIITGASIITFTLALAFVALILEATWVK